MVSISTPEEEVQALCSEGSVGSNEYRSDPYSGLSTVRPIKISISMPPKQGKDWLKAETVARATRKVANQEAAA